MFRGRGTFERGRGREDFSSNRGGKRGGKSNNGEQWKDKKVPNRPPPGLKGKEIGLWYAKRSKKRRKDRGSATFLPQLNMNSSQARHLGNVLDSLDTAEGECSNLTARKLTDFTDHLSVIATRSYDDAWEGNTAALNTKSESTLDKTINKMEESSFKRAYVANVIANQMQDTSRGSWRNELVSSEDLNQQYIDELQDKQSNERYLDMLKLRKKLPAYNMKDSIVEKIRDNQIVVLEGETGCGKTTQVAQFILDDMIESGKGSLCKIVCTQPRRISAISIAQRVADERGEELGISSGYQIRLEKVLPRTTGSILYCTTGVVLQWLQNNPLLSGVSHLVLDEIHERDTVSDFLICIIKDVLPKRPNLKLVLMSATLNADMFSKYYYNCPMLHIPGFTYPVKEFYLEDVIEATRFSFEENRNRKSWRLEQEYQEMIEPHLRKLDSDKAYSVQTLAELYNSACEEINLDLILELLRYITTKPPGAVLVFLPGWTEISKLDNMIKNHRAFNPRWFKVIPLHSMMPTTNQREVFDRPPSGVRKIVLATNIAETSITIDDIVYVVDCGKIKMKNFDKSANLATLLPQWVTLANAKQRRGRAGRVQAGVCYHLFSKARKMLLDSYPLPEIQRTPLEEIILHIKILKLGKVKLLLSKVMEAPDEEVIDLSLKTLETINALDSCENLTPLGFHLAQLPVDPLTGRMLIMGAIFSCLSPILTIASTLAFKDPFVVPLGKEKIVDNIKKRLSRNQQSDHLMYAYVYEEWDNACRKRHDRFYVRENFLSVTILNQIKNMRNQFLGLLNEHKLVDTTNTESRDINQNSDNVALVKAVITAGLYPNVGRIMLPAVWKQHKPVMIRTLYDNKVSLHPKSINEKEKHFTSTWLVYREKIKSTKVYLHDCTNVANYPILFFGQKLNYNPEISVIDVDGFVRLRCSAEIAKLVQSLREELDKLLEYKISHPGVCKWNKSSKEGLLLNTIVDLISSEDTSQACNSFEDIFNYDNEDEEDYEDQ